MAVIFAILPMLGALVLYGTLTLTGPWLRDQPGSIYLFIFGFILLAGLAIIPTNALMILAGFAYQWLWGGLAAWCGFAGAALVGFVIGRLFTGERATTLIASNPRWQAVYQVLIGAGASRALVLVTLLRLSQSPFSLTNFVLAAVRTPWLVYLAGTLIGVFPRVAIGGYVGSHLAVLDFSKGSNIVLMVVGIVFTIIVFGVIATLASRALERVTQRDATSGSPAE
jgi:uncharacterized membrane protein YdjX (TVP38/TMEM64 family)